MCSCGSRSCARASFFPVDPRAAPADRPGPVRGGDGGLRARGVHPLRSTTWSRRWASTPGSPSPRSPGSAPAWTRSSARSAPARLDHTEFPYVYLDATYLHVRNERTSARWCPWPSWSPPGSPPTARREILGLDVGDSEDEMFWRGFLTSLKKRGLAGVRLVISDQHAGLVAALRAVASRAPAHQRCRVHFARNLLAHVPKAHADMVAAVFRTIFAQPDADAVASSLGRGPRPARRPVPQDRPADGRRQGRGPRVHRVPQGALAQDLVDQPARAGQQGDQAPLPRRRASSPTRPPSSASSAPSWPTLHDEWQAGDRRYLSEASMALLYPDRDTEPIAAIDSGE